MTRAHEVNFDGLVGLTHNYAGLSFGNIASLSHKELTSRPKEAALQGLEKMKKLADLGLKQGVLPPQERPDVWVLRSLGFTGSEEEVIRKASRSHPELFSTLCSASSMWTANAATVSPSADTQDGKVHFTPANLVSKFHRSIEPETTSRVLKAIFSSEDHFVHHEPLVASSYFGDEGAANHTRFCSNYGEPGVALFVYGRRAFGGSEKEPSRYPARQTREASEAIARSHGLEPGRVFFTQQNPDAIDAGAFHNDVVAVGNQNFHFFHEKAFADPSINQSLAKAFRNLDEKSGRDFILMEVKEEEVRLEDAVKSYLFNSQLVSPQSETEMALIAPIECSELESVRLYIDHLVASENNPVARVVYLDVRQSMQNGGGPACLRLRVALKEEELKALSGNVLLTESLYSKLRKWIEKYYRDELSPDDLSDGALLEENRVALDELTQILELGSVYRFQG